MNWPFINDGRFSCWFRPGKPNALALGWEAGSENKLEQLKINWSSALPSKTSRRSLCWRIGNFQEQHLMRLGSSFRRFSSMSCSNINANRYNEFHHVTPHKNVATVVPWYRKTCRSECMFVPVVDSSVTEMSTRGVILLTEGSDELKSRYTLLKYNTARCACGNSRLWRHEPLRQWYTCWRKFGRWSRKPKALALGALTCMQIVL